MDRFRQVGENISNMNRSFLLAIGLVVVAVLIAATFIYGDNEGEIASNNNNGNTTSEVTADDNGDEQSEREDEAGDESDESNEASVEDGEELPAELADTGPALPAAGMILLGAGGYLYRHSQKQLKDANLDS